MGTLLLALALVIAGPETSAGVAVAVGIILTALLVHQTRCDKQFHQALGWEKPPAEVKNPHA